MLNKNLQDCKDYDKEDFTFGPAAKLALTPIQTSE
jgi:hypothetical protein